MWPAKRPVRVSIDVVEYILVERRRTSTDVVDAVFAAIGAQPTGDGVDVDAVAD